jgi:hypothetical protein
MFGCRALASIMVRYELAALGASTQHKMLSTSYTHRLRAEQNDALPLDIPARRDTDTVLSRKSSLETFYIRLETSTTNTAS